MFCSASDLLSSPLFILYRRSVWLCNVSNIIVEKSANYEINLNLIFIR